MTEAVAETQEVTTVSLKEICDELGIKTANARQRLRSKMKTDANGTAGFRWVFPIEKKGEIVAFLKEAEERKAARATKAETEGEGSDAE